MGAALGDDPIRELLFDGEKVRSDVIDMVTGAEVERTIDGAPTLTVNIHDSRNVLLEAGIFGARLTAQVEDYDFELVRVGKSGSNLTATFEDLAVAALRRRDEPRKAAAGTTTRVEFARRLVAEEEWIGFVAPPSPSRAKVELARGSVDAEAGDDEEEKKDREDTWTALGRLANEVGWTRFSRGGEIWFVPDRYLLDADPILEAHPHRGPVLGVDFDFDIGKPVATATLTVIASRWAVPPGGRIELTGVGPADGPYLVASVRRSLFDATAAVSLRGPVPSLPEPDPPPAPTADELGPEGDPTGSPQTGAGGSGGGARVNTGGASAGGYVWPVRGRVSSGYGQRWGRLHAGIDISVGVGTPIGATRGGTVTFSGMAGGYGAAVYIRHPDGTFSRYGHLSKLIARRGQTVSAGQRIGLSGGAAGSWGAGNSRGPHLHFEIRPGDRPADPMRFLP